ncbi:MAG: hypothetical protein AVDCRST_MAG10-1098, partial [uncultured Acidimicrobiales bacterium]
ARPLRPPVHLPQHRRRRPSGPTRRTGPSLGRVRPRPARGGRGRPAGRGLGHQVRPHRQAARRRHEEHHRQGQV